MRHLLILLILSFKLSCYAQFNQILHTKVKLKEELTETINFKIDSILIVAAGPSIMRIFVNDVSNKLSASLKRENIHVEFYYLGNSDAEAEANFNRIDKTGFNTFLSFHAIDTIGFGTNYKGKAIYATPGRNRITPIITNSRTVMQNNLLIRAFKLQNQIEIYWSAHVEVECDPGKSLCPTTLSNKIIQCFKDRKYID